MVVGGCFGIRCGLGWFVCVVVSILLGLSGGVCCVFWLFGNLIMFCGFLLFINSIIFVVFNIYG